MSVLITPRDPDDITGEWLSAALEMGGALPKATLVDFRLEGIGEGAGFTSTIVRAHLKFDQSHSDLPASCIIKMPSVDPDVRAAAMAADLFGRENTFYARYPKDGPGRPPVHYYSVADQEKDDFILIIEDIGHARFVGQIEGASAEDASAIVRTLGRIHAHHWQNDTLDGMAWLPTFHVLADAFIPTFKDGTPLLIENFGYLLSEEIQASMDAGTDAYRNLVDYTMKQPTSLVHGDARIENFAFENGSGPNSVRLFDWAGALRGSAIYDLTYFLGSSLKVPLRREIEAELLSIYHEELIEGNVQDFSMDDLQDAMRVASCLMFGFMSYVGTLVPPDDAGHAVMGAMVPRLVEIMRDYDAIETLKRF